MTTMRAPHRAVHRDLAEADWVSPGVVASICARTPDPTACGSALRHTASVALSVGSVSALCINLRLAAQCPLTRWGEVVGEADPASGGAFEGTGYLRPDWRLHQVHSPGCTYRAPTNCPGVGRRSG